MSKRPNRRPSGDSLPPTLIEYVLDETGSMGAYKSKTITGFNAFVTEQRAQPNLGLLTLTKFHTERSLTPYVDLDLRMVPEMTGTTFQPGASTNLRDALMQRIESLNARLQSWDIVPQVLIALHTDGADNASRRSVAEVRHSLASHMERGWTFVFLGAYAGARDAALALGFPEGNIKVFEGAETHQAYTAMSASTTTYRSAGLTVSSSNYFSG